MTSLDVLAVLFVEGCAQQYLALEAKEKEKITGTHLTEFYSQRNLYPIKNGITKIILASHL